MIRTLTRLFLQIQLSQLAATAEFAGTISSAFESRAIHEATPTDFLSITPGIRLAGDAVGDQNRVVTPARAREMGANGIVVGRSITQAADPVAAYQRVVAEFQGNSDDRLSNRSCHGIAQK